jgi:hypothetical protein
MRLRRKHIRVNIHTAKSKAVVRLLIKQLRKKKKKKKKRKQY